MGELQNPSLSLSLPPSTAAAPFPANNTDEKAEKWQQMHSKPNSCTFTFGRKKNYPPIADVITDTNCKADTCNSANIPCHPQLYSV